jgi:hypothetical protein
MIKNKALQIYKKKEKLLLVKINLFSFVLIINFLTLITPYLING